MSPLEEHEDVQQSAEEGGKYDIVLLRWLVDTDGEGWNACACVYGDRERA